MQACLCLPDPLGQTLKYSAETLCGIEIANEWQALTSLGG